MAKSNHSNTLNASHTSTFGAIASGHRLTTQAAQEILEQGGNAYDAIIAAALVATAAEPVLASLGGGGFFIGKERNKNVQCLDFFTQSPIDPPNATLHIQEKITVKFSNTSQDFYIGAASTATPGVVKGLFEIHSKLGHLPVKEIFTHASTLIKQGITVNKAQHSVFKLVEQIYLSSNDSCNLYKSKQNCTNNEIINANEIFYNIDLADTIDHLGHEGADLFYRGDIANKISHLMRENNGSIQYKDLINYQSIWRKPLKYSINGQNKTNIYANNSPAIGGYYLKSILKDYETYFVNRQNTQQRLDIPFDMISHYDTLARRLHQLFSPFASAKDFKLDNKDMDILDVMLTSRKIAPKGTTHISVIDKNNNLAAITLSNGEGNGLIIPDTGIMLNNMLGEDDVNPLAPNSWNCNQRLSSMMTPLIMENNNDYHIMGTGGSNRIPTALAQTIIQLLFWQKNIEEAVNYSRIHFDKAFNMEHNYDNKDAFDKLLSDIMSKYPSTINVFDRNDFYFGGVNITKSTKNGKLSAYSDIRRT